MRKPDFFIVGAPRCATTALHNYLGRHPDIYVPKVKESHHFATDLLGRDDCYRSTDNYLALFACATNEIIIGEASVFYLYSKYAARNIYDFNNRARIIVVLRNPTEMLASYHAQLLYKGDEYIRDLNVALEAEEQRRKGLMLPRKIRFKEKLYYSDIVCFSEQLKRYLDTFGKQAVHVVIYDDLKLNPEVVLRQALEFLGVDPMFQTEFNVINPHKRARSAALRALLRNSPRKTKSVVRTVLPRAVRHEVRNIIMRFNTLYEPRPSMRGDMKTYLQAKFAKEVEILTGLIGRDLTSWSQG